MFLVGQDDGKHAALPLENLAQALFPIFQAQRRQGIDIGEKLPAFQVHIHQAVGDAAGAVQRRHKLAVQRPLGALKGLGRDALPLEALHFLQNGLATAWGSLDSPENITVA